MNDKYITVGRDYYPGLELPLCVLHGKYIDEITSDRFRIILTTEGSSSVTINNVKHFLISPAVFLLNEQDTLIFDDMNALKTISVLYHPEVINTTFSFKLLREEEPGFTFTAMQDAFLLDTFIHRNKETPKLLFMSVQTRDRIQKVISLIEGELVNQWSDCWTCSSRSYLFELLLILGQLAAVPHYTTSFIKPSNDDLIDRVLLYIHSNYAEAITLNDLVTIFNTNRTTLGTRFKEKTGSTIMNYIAQIRIKMAASMLHSTDLNIVDIMHRVGFEDKANFSRHFKKKLGLSPSEYRKEYCWML